MERRINIKIPENNTEKTVEQVLYSQAGLTRKQISQAKFRPEGITRNGIRCRVNTPVVPGDLVSVCLEEDSSSSRHLLPSEDAADLQILYEDADLVAVNKPAGILTHPSGGHYRDTLSNQLVQYFQKKKEQVLIRPVGRLDKETSGIVLFAKNQIAAARLQKQREDHLLCKQYLAVVEGSLPADSSDLWHTISYPVIKISDHPIKMAAVNPDFLLSGLSVPLEVQKTAVTHYQTLKSATSWSLVSVRLPTGRTHQIRVHMQSIGHPLLGDRIYGASALSGLPVFERAALHAWRVTFQQPFTDKEISLEAPLPEDFAYLSR